jgi:hypothetical protein
LQQKLEAEQKDLESVKHTQQSVGETNLEDVNKRIDALGGAMTKLQAQTVRDLEGAKT